MRISRLLLAALLSLFLCGMRDPFQPPQDICRTAQLSNWHFHGAVAGDQPIGIVRDATGRWYRLIVGETLPTGWRVVAIQQDEMLIEIGEECTPAQWRWQREGTQHAKMDSERDAL